MLKKFCSIFLLFLWIVSLAACSPSQTEKNKKEIVIGFSQLGAESTWRKRNTKSILDAAKKNDIQVMYENAMQSQENQIKSIRSFISYQVDLIILSPIVETGWDTVLKEAKNAHIPVIILDREVNLSDNSLYTTHIGSNFKSQGIRAGQFLLNKFKDSSKQKLNIIEVLGTENSSPTIYRQQGFQEIISRDKRLQIVQEVSGDFITSKGAEIIRNLKNTLDLKNIDVIYSHNDDMTLGIVAELKKLNLVPGKDIVIVTTDAQTSIMEMLEKGTVNCVVECNPNSGDITMNVVKKILAGKRISKEIYMTETSFSEFSNLSKLPYRNY